MIVDKNFFMTYARIHADKIPFSRLHISGLEGFVPSGWIFPKLAPDDSRVDREAIVQALQWVKDVGLYDSYVRMAESNLADRKMAESEMSEDLPVCRTEFQSLPEEGDTGSKERPLGLKDFNLLFQFTGMMYATATCIFVMEIIWWDFLSPWLRNNGRKIIKDMRCLLPQLLKPVKFKKKPRVAQVT